MLTKVGTLFQKRLEVKTHKEKQLRVTSQSYVSRYVFLLLISFEVRYFRGYNVNKSWYVIPKEIRSKNT